jgi:hypothetical protein
VIMSWIEDEAVFDWLYSQPILDEYRTILRRLQVPIHAVGRLMNALRQAGVEVEARDIGRFSPDPHNDPFYHCGIVGNAAYIVTDNVVDFPPLPRRKKPQIITPEEAVRRLRLRGSKGR